MLNLIERVANPIEILRRANDLLAPRGVVWLQAPNFHSLDARLFRNRSWAGPRCPRYWAVLGGDGLRRALDGAGLSPLRSGYTQPGTFLAASRRPLRKTSQAAVVAAGAVAAEGTSAS